MRAVTIMVALIFFSRFIRISTKRSFKQIHCENANDLKLIVEEIVEEIATHSSCIVFITDSVYRGLIDMRAIEISVFFSKFNIIIRDNDNFSRPRKKVSRVLQYIKATGCDAYVILIANGLLTSRFLQYVEGERLINTRGYFLLLYDSRLFRPELHYIWNRIVNVVFIRQYNTYKYRSGERVTVERIDLNTVYYPSHTRDFMAIKYIDTWHNGKLRYGNDHYMPKSTNLHGNGLRPNAWIALLCTLLMGSGAFYVFALFYQKYVVSRSFLKNNKTTNVYERGTRSARSLYLFTEFQNSILYTYSMLLQVSLPRLPNAWTVRIFIGWWWIYSILAAVIYRASMTATLSHPVAKVTIDTLAQLTRSSLAIGGWDEESKGFFLASSDPHSQEIGNKFELTDDEGDAIDRVANGTFCYYENSYLLQHARGRRIFEKQNDQPNSNEKSTGSTVKYNLHIMEECVVHMPIALGLEKNSPLKPYVDLWVRRMTETGLVHKWLSDVMEWSKINESQLESKSETALVNLRKLYGAFVALGIGYLLGFIALLGEILYWRYVVLKDPRYDKYHLDQFYRNNNKSKV
ncbi:hypothetical protein P5V15_003163 [Pogonomyrmex californicus]